MIYKKALIFISLTMFLLLIVNFNNTNYKSDFKESYKIFAIDIPDSVTFCGEPLPLQNKYVKQAFDRELLVNTYWQSQTLLFIKLANQYFPTIESILKENNIPDDFKYITLVESGLRNVVSPVGAAGYWHFMESTATDYNLEVNDVVDERLHIQKSTKAACDFFNKSYEKFNNWTLVAASFNAGINGIEKQIERQAENNYYNLNFDEEASRYVFRIVALKEILTNPSKYGFQYRKCDLYKPDNVTYIEIDTAISNFKSINELYNISYKELKYYNPWLLENYLHDNNKTYRIAIPVSKK